MLFADLQKQPQGLAYLSFLDIEHHALESASGIAGFYIRHGLASTEDTAQTKCTISKNYVKALIKGHKMAVQAAKLLSGKEDGDSTQMTITETAFVGGPPSEGHAKDLEGSRPLHDKLISNGKTMYDRVCLQSGMCLFSMDMIQSSLDANGRVDAARLSRSSPTLYEVEYIARACPVIADVGAMIFDMTARAKAQNPNFKDISLQVGLDVPSFHYFHSVQSKLQEERCTFQEALRWMQVVIQRHEQISEVFQGYLQHELAQRGVEASQMKIEISRRGITVAAHILEALGRSQMPSFDEVLKRLGEEDDTWNDFWDMLPPKERAVDFRSLSYLFYVYEVIRPALAGNIVPIGSRPTSKSDMGRLVIGIDDGAERRIYSRSQKLLKKLRNHPAVERLPSLMEIYMSRRVFINNNEEGSNLYLDDPSPGRPIVTAWKQMGVEKDVLQSSFSDFGPYDLARNLHGEKATKVLRELFDNVDLITPQ